MKILVRQQNPYQWRTLHTHIPARPVTSMERLPHLLEMLGLVCVVNWEQMSVTFTMILILKHHLSSENKYILLKSNKIFLNALIFISIQSVRVLHPYSKTRTTSNSIDMNLCPSVYTWILTMPCMCTKWVHNNKGT